MFDKKYWRERFPLDVQAYGGPGFAAARIRTYTEGDYALKKVAKTEDGYGVFEVHLSARGDAPIIASTSDTYDFDFEMAFGSMTVTLPYENIADVNIKLANDSSVAVC